MLVLQLTPEWASNVTQKLLAASHAGVNAVQQVLPAAVVQDILEALCSLVVKEATVVEVSQTLCAKQTQ